jgi:hypothetical protein
MQVYTGLLDHTETVHLYNTGTNSFSSLWKKNMILFINSNYNYIP